MFKLQNRKRRREGSHLLLSATLAASSGRLPEEDSSAMDGSNSKKKSKSCTLTKWGRKIKGTRKLSSQRCSAPCDTKEDSNISNFIAWCYSNGITISGKVALTRTGSCANIGMVATQHIAVGEQLAHIPKSALLCARNSGVCEVMLADREFMTQLETASSWVPLMAALIYEHSKINDGSKWAPYLSIVPNPESLPPLFMWRKFHCDLLLTGTTLPERVKSDLQNIEHDYEAIVRPFMERHPEMYRKSMTISSQLYKELVGFVMSYSFTNCNKTAEEEEDEDDDDEDDRDDNFFLEMTSLVPVIDLLNHHYRHHAELNVQDDHFELIVVRDIAKGEEVMNTYGQSSNVTLLQMYGFALPDNPHDEALLPANLVLRAVLDAYSNKDRKLRDIKRRWASLTETDIYSDSELLRVDSRGIPESRLLELTQLLTGKEAHFQEVVRMLLLTKKQSFATNKRTSTQSTVVDDDNDDHQSSMGCNSGSKGDGDVQNGCDEDEENGGSEETDSCDSGSDDDKEDAGDDDHDGSFGDGDSESQSDDDGDSESDGSLDNLEQDAALQCVPKRLLFGEEGGDEQTSSDVAKQIEEITALPVEVKVCLGRLIELHMEFYPETPTQIRRVLDSKRSKSTEKMAALACYGQQSCLLALLNHLQGIE